PQRQEGEEPQTGDCHRIMGSAPRTQESSAQKEQLIAQESSIGIGELWKRGISSSCDLGSITPITKLPNYEIIAPCVLTSAVCLWITRLTLVRVKSRSASLFHLAATSSTSAPVDAVLKIRTFPLLQQPASRRYSAGPLLRPGFLNQGRPGAGDCGDFSINVHFSRGFTTAS